MLLIPACNQDGEQIDDGADRGHRPAPRDSYGILPGLHHTPINKPNCFKSLKAFGLEAVKGRVTVGVVLCLFLTGVAAAAEESEALWRLMRGGGMVVVLRHASTESGVGDPPGFRLEDCATQRNLSQKGQDEARRLGAAFRAHGIQIGRVLSSRWCRCRETAMLAFGAAETWPPLDSFFSEPGRGAEQTQAVRKLIAQPPGTGNLVLVTHQVNITALTGLAVTPGEIVVLIPEREGAFRVAGRLRLGNGPTGNRPETREPTAPRAR